MKWNIERIYFIVDVKNGFVNDINIMESFC
jgi:hypothetical protein